MAQRQFDQYRQGNVDPLNADALENRLGLVRKGMKVVDAAGNDVGRVDYVKMGDPEAITDQGELSGGGRGFFVPPAPSGGGSTGSPIVAAPWWPADDADWGPDVPEPIKSRLIRSGYFKVDGPILFGKNRYVPANLVASVGNDTVRLSVNKDELPVED
jgi:hypothetical protein